jgi:hypothetical protein
MMSNASETIPTVEPPLTTKRHGLRRRTRQEPTDNDARLLKSRRKSEESLRRQRGNPLIITDNHDVTHWMVLFLQDYEF